MRLRSALWDHPTATSNAPRGALFGAAIQRCCAIHMHLISWQTWRLDTSPQPDLIIVSLPSEVALEQWSSCSELHTILPSSDLLHLLTFGRTLDGLWRRIGHVWKAPFVAPVVLSSGPLTRVSSDPVPWFLQRVVLPHSISQSLATSFYSKSAAGSFPPATINCPSSPSLCSSARTFSSSFFIHLLYLLDRFLSSIPLTVFLPFPVPSLIPISFYRLSVRFLLFARSAALVWPSLSRKLSVAGDAERTRRQQSVFLRFIPLVQHLKGKSFILCLAFETPDRC